MDCEAKGKAQFQPIADTSSFQPDLTISCNTYACFYRKEFICTCIVLQTLVCNYKLYITSLCNIITENLESIY